MDFGVGGIRGGADETPPRTEEVSSSPSIESEIENKGGYDILKFIIHPGGTVMTNQESMSYMDGGLVTTATAGQGGITSAIMRSIAGSSSLENKVMNPTQSALRLYLSPMMQGSIVKVDITEGETWNLADKSFLACTPTLKVSGNLNVFRNFKLLFAGGTLSYVSVSAPPGSGGGSVWIYAYGGHETHEIEMGVHPPLFINHGCFLGMKSEGQGIQYWSDYVKVGTANGFLNSIFTDTGFLMKIQDSVPPKRPGTKVTVMTQSLNRAHFEKYINTIAKTQAQEVMSSQSDSESPRVSGLFPTLWRLSRGETGGTRKAKRSKTGKKMKQVSATRKSVPVLRGRQ
jgi:uncharacterized protein (AIM24 family)